MAEFERLISPYLYFHRFHHKKNKFITMNYPDCFSFLSICLLHNIMLLLVLGTMNQKSEYLACGYSLCYFQRMKLRQIPLEAAVERKNETQPILIKFIFFQIKAMN